VSSRLAWRTAGNVGRGGGNLNNYLTAFAPGNVAASGQPWVVAQGTGAVITVASPPAPGTNVAQVSGDTRLRDVLSINWLAGQEYTLDLWLLVPSGNVIGSPSVSWDSSPWVAESAKMA
jgi:hypothetical protein